MSKNNKQARKGDKRRFWGVDVIAVGFLGITALMIQLALHESGAGQAWAVFVASGAAATGLGLLLRYAPARQVVIMALALVFVVEVGLLVGTGQPQAALASLGSYGMPSADTLPRAGLARLAVAALFLAYLVRPQVARSFTR